MTAAPLLLASLSADAFANSSTSAMLSGRDVTARGVGREKKELLSMPAADRSGPSEARVVCEEDQGKVRQRKRM